MCSNWTVKRSSNASGPSHGTLDLAREFLANASDAIAKGKLAGQTGQIFVDFDATKLSVENGGKVMPVKKGEDGLYIPERNFTELRSGDNFTDHCVGAGMNGFGGKLGCIFADELRVECGDTESRYTQTWYDNRTRTTGPQIEPDSGPGFVSIAWKPSWRSSAAIWNPLWAIFRWRA